MFRFQENLPFEVEVFHSLVINIKYVIFNLFDLLDPRTLMYFFSLRFTFQLGFVVQKKLSLRDLPLPSVCHCVIFLCGWQLS